MAILLEAGSSGPDGASAATSFKSCPRQYALSYEAPNAARSDSPATALGTLVHAGLAQHYARILARQHGADPAAYMSPDEAIEAHRSKGLLYANQAAQAQKLVVGHEAKWANLESRWTILGVEYLFAVDFTVDGHTAKRTGRADLVFSSAGRFYLLDHKTAGRITATTAQEYGRSDQFLALQYAGIEAWGEAFGGVVCNLIQSDGERYIRPPLPPVAGFLRDYPASVVYYAKLRDQLRAAGKPPAEWPAAISLHACRNRYADCPHLQACTWGGLTEPAADE